METFIAHSYSNDEYFLANFIEILSLSENISVRRNVNGRPDGPSVRCLSGKHNASAAYCLAEEYINDDNASQWKSAKFDPRSLKTFEPIVI